MSIATLLQVSDVWMKWLYAMMPLVYNLKARMYWSSNTLLKS